MLKVLGHLRIILAGLVLGILLNELFPNISTVTMLTIASVILIVIGLYLTGEMVVDEKTPELNSDESAKYEQS